jgi:HPt (histidine-containing phosphotransfer) domain-containing protein
MADPDETLQRRLAELRDRFVAGFAERMSTMQGGAEQLEGASSLDEALAALKVIRAEAHKLVGTAATFGFALAGDAAGVLEASCDALIENGAMPSPDDRNRLSDQITAVERETPISS